MDLTAEQRALVQHPVDSRAMLIVAGPGSGKTRVLCERIIWLLDQGVEAHQIAALTFTQQAAFEMSARIQANDRSGVWAGTFHAFASKLLHEHGARWGVPIPFKVIDELRQTYLLRETAEEILGWRCDAFKAKDVLNQISLRKRRGLGAGDETYIGLRDIQIREIQLIDEAYCRRLRENALLDYDDLISHCNFGLMGDESSAETVRSTARWLFVDEFQDVSQEQYAFIRLISPPADERAHLMVVGDPRQSIYGFRGADPNRISKQFLHEYDPQLKHLNENFRSVPSIVACANAIQPQRKLPQVLYTHRISDQQVVVIETTDERSEAVKIADLIEKRLLAGDKPGSIGVLYGIHRRADLIEEVLQAREIKVNRIRPGDLFQRGMFDAALAMLQVCANPETADADALAVIAGAPSSLLDEFDRDDFERLELDLPTEVAVSPGGHRRFRMLQSVMTSIRSGARSPAASIVMKSLLKFQRQLLDPVCEDDRFHIDETIRFLDGKLSPKLHALKAAVARGREIVIVIEGHASADIHIGKVILQTALAELPEANVLQPRFVVAINAPLCADAEGIELTPIGDHTVSFSYATQCWFLGQQLLATGEDRPQHFVVFDIETTSFNAKSARIIELAAVRINQAGQQIGEPFEHLVYANSLSGEVSRLTGIRLFELQDAPPIEDVLTEFQEWLRPDDCLVGHNIADFDLPILKRHAKEAGLPPFEQRFLDTVELARRLFPSINHKLGSLATSFGCEQRPAHRALPDVLTNIDVWHCLLAERRRRMTMRSFDDALPLVAASILLSGAKIGLDNQVLLNAGARSWRSWPQNPMIANIASIAGREWNECLRYFQEMKASREEEEWDLFQSDWEGKIERHMLMRPDISLSELSVNLVLAAGGIRESSDEFVSMMTVHAAKGKEWDTVVISAVEGDLFPTKGLKTPTAEEIEEGERLLYVGVTRAKDRLALFNCGWRGDKKHYPHPLLEKFPADEAIVLRFKHQESQPIAAG